MSPYCTLIYNDKKLKTDCHNNGGKFLIWGDKFSLDVVDSSKDLELRVWDKDIIKSHALGLVKIRMASLMFDGETT